MDFDNIWMVVMRYKKKILLVIGKNISFFSEYLSDLIMNTNDENFE